MMKLHWSPRSPFVRKVMIVAYERNFVNRLNCVRSVAAATKSHAELMKDNPLSKIPTLVLEDGSPLYDSPVICEYLDALDGAPKLFPVDPETRLVALRRQALADGFLDLLLLWRGELMRAKEIRSEIHLQNFAERTAATLAVIDADALSLGNTPYSIGHVATGCALSYLDFRFPFLDWRKGHDRAAAWHKTFAARPSTQATEVVDDS
jgi:glutathione S-transferase